MIGEINKDFYCTAGYPVNSFGECHIRVIERQDAWHCHRKACGFCHRKHPTPEQFEAEYKFKYPDDAAVYALTDNEWRVNTYFAAKHTKLVCVCACTPWGPPPDDWRPS